ncbi:MAG TPA: hypothetical protein VFO73_15105 [Candidatus Limnocylindrales bacterium]|nr:hypothetical protein [Candidatus Limnocylindrales bacterium]
MKPGTIIAVTSEDRRHRPVIDRAAAIGSETGATVILFDLDADLGPLMSPLPTEWSGDGTEQQFGDRLDPGDLDAAGQSSLADQVRVVRAAGVNAFGWLPPKADGPSLAEYAADQQADHVVVSTEDAELVDALRSSGIRVEAVPPG